MPNEETASGSGDLTLLLNRAADGDVSAAERILPLVYGELRKLAASRMAREAPGQTLQATALVHEAWLRLGGDRQPEWRSRAQFFSAAAEAMRRILIESVRRKRAARHGGGAEKVDLDAVGVFLASPEAEEEALWVHEALDALAQHDPRKAELVKQRYFVGLEFAEIAAILDVSERTVMRDWAYARAWLYRELELRKK